MGKLTKEEIEKTEKNIKRIRKEVDKLEKRALMLKSKENIFILGISVGIIISIIINAIICILVYSGVI